MASASAHVYGLSQSASGGTASLATVDNEGTIDIGLVAKASGATSAIVHAFGNAVYQVVGSGTASYTNKGSLSIHASDSAIATGHGFAAATALGVAQSVTGGHDIFVNNGTTDVGAKAFVSASTGDAFAYARGYAAKGSAADLDVTNAGSISVAASATAPDTVRALAVGMYLSAAATTAATTPVQSAILSGTVVNSGDLQRRCPRQRRRNPHHRHGQRRRHHRQPEPGDGHRHRHQFGINDLTVTNTGTISVDAITANGAPALAYGIHVLGSGGGVAPAASDVFTINNSGDIIARQSTDGGTTFHRGDGDRRLGGAEPTVINLLGKRHTSPATSSSRAMRTRSTSRPARPFNGVDQRGLLRRRGDRCRRRQSDAELVRCRHAQRQRWRQSGSGTTRDAGRRSVLRLRRHAERWAPTGR